MDQAEIDEAIKNSDRPFEELEFEQLRKGLDFEGDPEGATLLLLTRMKNCLNQDRHLIPKPAQIILDEEFEFLDREVELTDGASWVYTQCTAIHTMFELVCEMVGVLNLAKAGICFPNTEAQPDLKLFSWGDGPPRYAKRIVPTLADRHESGL